jgi:SulP family sulfate permease
MSRNVEGMIKTVDPSLYRNRDTGRERPGVTLSIDDLSRGPMAQHLSLVDISGDGKQAPGVPPDDIPPLPGRIGWLLRHIPALDSLRSYSWRALGADLTAGLTVATVAAPQAMAYATLAGVPPQYGLYTAIVMTAAGALFDSSRQLINGPTNAISIALLSALAVVPEGERVPAAVLLAFLVGAAQLGIALLRLGDLTRFVSHSVIVGFTVGAGTLLVLDQMKHLLGLEARGQAADHFLKRFWLSLTDGGSVHWPTFLIGVGTIVVVVALRRVNGLRRVRGAWFPIPQHLVAVALMAALVWAFQLDARYGVKIVGAIPASLPRFEFPDLKWDRVRLLADNALAIAVLGLLEAVAMAKAIASRTGQTLDINQQCLSEGAANLAGSFFQCIPGSGSLTRSAINQQAGAVSQWSGVFSAAAVAGTVLLFAPLAQYIPRSSLAGLLMLAAFRMVDYKQLVFHLRATRFDAGVIIVTALAALVVSVEFCIFIGVFLSFVFFVSRAAKVRMTRLARTSEQRIREIMPGDAPCDRMLYFGLEGELFFGAEPELQKHFAAVEQAAQGKVRVVILVLKWARNPDAAFLNQLKKLDGKLQQRNIALLLCAVQSDLGRALAGTGLENTISPRRIFHERPNNGSSIREAVNYAYELLGNDLCSTCPQRKATTGSNEPMDYVI